MKERGGRETIAYSTKQHRQELQRRHERDRCTSEISSPAKSARVRRLSLSPCQNSRSEQRNHTSAGGRERGAVLGRQLSLLGHAAHRPRTVFLAPGEATQGIQGISALMLNLHHRSGVR
jgi:hypothetical protein